MKTKIMLFLVLVLFIFTSCTTTNTNTTIEKEIIANTALTSEINTGGCPKHISYDPYPGLCGLYTDKNANNECDYGE